MKKRYLFLIIFILTGIVMYFTNPSIEKHQQAVYAELKSVIDEELKGSNAEKLKDINPAMLEQLAQPMTAEAVVVEDYKVFSLTKLNLGTQIQPVGLGVFSKVFIAPQFKTKVKEEIGKYQNYFN